MGSVDFGRRTSRFWVLEMCAGDGPFPFGTLVDVVERHERKTALQHGKFVQPCHYSTVRT